MFMIILKSLVLAIAILGTGFSVKPQSVNVQIAPSSLAKWEVEKAKTATREPKYFIKDSSDVVYREILRDGSASVLPLLTTSRAYGNAGYSSIFEAIPGISFTARGFVVGPNFKPDNLTTAIATVLQVQDKIQFSEFSSSREWQSVFVKTLVETKVGGKSLADTFVFAVPRSRSQIFDSRTGFFYPSYLEIPEGQSRRHAIFDPLSKKGVVIDDSQYWRRFDGPAIVFAKNSDEQINESDLVALLVCTYDPDVRTPSKNVVGVNNLLLLSVDLTEVLIYDKSTGIVYGRVHV